MTTATRTLGPLTVGRYEPTAPFRAMGPQACVCDAATRGLVAVTGPAEDPESQRYADLFAAAPDHATVARLLITGLLRWQPDRNEPQTGELYFGGLYYPSTLDEFGVPMLTGTLRGVIARTAGGAS